MSDHVKMQLPTVEAENPERCETCRFWWFRSDGRGGGDCSPLESTDEPWGLCRRFPPKTQGEDIYDTHHSFNLPILAPTDWCGEWQAKRVPPDTVLRSIDITTVADTARGVTVAMLFRADGSLTDPVVTVN